MCRAAQSTLLRSGVAVACAPRRRSSCDAAPHPAAAAAAAARGFTMVTSQPVEQGAPLLAVPRALLMSAETARASPICGALIQRAGLDDWQVGDRWTGRSGAEWSAA
jgi:hypothetical protein